jgi:hypothetical protein
MLDKLFQNYSTYILHHNLPFSALNSFSLANPFSSTHSQEHLLNRCSLLGAPLCAKQNTSYREILRIRFIKTEHKYKNN